MMYVIIGGFAYSHHCPSAYNLSCCYDQLCCSCNGIISESQFGFCKGESTNDNLGAYQVSMLESLGNGDEIMYADASWSSNFLLGGSQAVYVDSYHPHMFEETSRVTQG